MKREYMVSFTALRIGSGIDGNSNGNAEKNIQCEFFVFADSSVEAITEMRKRIRVIAEWKGYTVIEELPDALEVYDCRVCEWRLHNFFAEVS